MTIQKVAMVRAGYTGERSLDRLMQKLVRSVALSIVVIILGFSADGRCSDDPDHEGPINPEKRITWGDITNPDQGVVYKVGNAGDWEPLPSRAPAICPLPPELPGIEATPPDLSSLMRIPIFRIPLSGGRTGDSLGLWGFLRGAGRLKLIPLERDQFDLTFTVLGFVQRGDEFTDLVFRNPGQPEFSYGTAADKSPVMLANRNRTGKRVGDIFGNFFVKVLRKVERNRGDVWKKPQSTFRLLTHKIVPHTQSFSCDFVSLTRNHELYLQLITQNLYADGLTFDEKVASICGPLRKYAWSSGALIPVRLTNPDREFSIQLACRLEDSYSGYIEEILKERQPSGPILESRHVEHYSARAGELLKIRVSDLLQLQLAIMFQPSNLKLFCQLVDLGHPDIVFSWNIPAIDTLGKRTIFGEPFPPEE
ncbi:MAG: hypothetical protein LBC25_01735 [Holosporales bacterium]|nr:hypothetical protein [Holosporales bacterium]